MPPPSHPAVNFGNRLLLGDVEKATPMTPTAYSMVRQNDNLQFEEGHTGLFENNDFALEATSFSLLTKQIRSSSQKSRLSAVFALPAYSMKLSTTTEH